MSTATTQEFPELGCYGLAGHATSPRDLVAEARRAEELGLGAVFLSERFNAKDAGVMAGVVAGVTDRIGIATAATNHNTRHPLVTATMAATAHRVSQGRYALGLGRGFDFLFDIMGLPRVTSAQIEDAVGIYRTLWGGGAVAGHDGPAGTFPYLVQDPSYDEAIPVVLVAIGERTLRLAGRIADGVVLHTCLTDEATRKSVSIVREAAADAGRDPASVRIWSVMGTVTDLVPEELRLRKTVGRLATYLQGYGPVLARANGWDLDDLERFRADELVAGYQGGFDSVGTSEELIHLRDDVLPASWLATMATGSPAQCAARIAGQLDTGVDSVVLHGATPDEIAPILPEWRAIRPAGLDRLPVNPGRIR
ncbi:TIGR03857 family LLM class F420-dependent oxidoreductase [Nocardioides sp. zg-536]|uniref:TIGR03857 family LLM class F420-dependent oxidoreductase n=1 Tax=Nocardioides faecalis TaxID=2803858 RepID=A0A939BVN6_9ACTN|nr:TIGR03857 family LLM class F420-dependent oxidoreductase [Nocardioides faecalis]MBM9460151.1 TIGR03857 family LLM class F420-dependent oxidoreductase [Nocardioides faecalis]QVI60054.1 TIGR03857 family LLM class F420-dependent oxidoreductase [Nocardioides faecalis]